MAMKTTKQGDIILTSTEAKVLLSYLNKQKANLEHDLPFMIDNIRLIMIRNQALAEDKYYSII